MIAGFTDTSPEMRKDKEVLLQVVKFDQYALDGRFTPIEMRSDREVVLEAVKAFPKSIHYASEDLKQDETLIMEAIRCEANSMKTMNPVKAVERILWKGPLQIFRRNDLPIYNETFEFIKKEYSFLIPAKHSVWDYLFETYYCEEESEEEYQGYEEYEAEEEYEEYEEEGVEEMDL